ncbi:MAG: hypothetical protein DIJKHBIC_04220 [Thermoanaerobaculia bacterium]|nr:hypothetical protein [Thermoanaerobaculia bacterium]
MSDAIWTAGEVPHVLFVGDESGCRDELTAALGAGWAIQPANDGIHAMDLLKHPNRPASIVVVLDLSMPVLEGFGFEKARRADSELSHIPVVLVTSHAADERVKKFGARAYVKRPIVVGDLAAVVRELGEG